MTAELTPDPVWVIDDTGFPKQGRHSVRVECQHSGKLGKTTNCQVAVSLHQVGREENMILLHVNLVTAACRSNVDTVRTQKIETTGCTVAGLTLRVTCDRATR
jgi:hypothetical protein